MLAVGIVLAVFACWGVVGYALTSSLLPRCQAISNLLLAPVVGMGALELAAQIGLRLELPVGQTAHAIVFSALLVAAAILVFHRPPLPLTRYLPFASIFLVALGLSGWPLALWGGDWIANANNDMANYCLGSTGFRDHGFRSFPAQAYLAGGDLTHALWSQYADCIGSRRGSELSLAMVSAISGEPVPLVFMPVTLAMHLVLVSSVGYLLHRLAGGRRVAWIACGLMAISPLSTYGVIQQLIAQVGGLGLLTAATGFYLRPARRLSLGGLLRRSALGGILAASLLLHYIEAVPFLVAAFGLHVVGGLARSRRDLKQVAIAALSAVLVVPLIGSFLAANLGYLVGQSRHGGQTDTRLAGIFPQYLHAEGLARLWGFATNFDPVTVQPDSPWPVHRLVVVGGLFLLLTLAAGIALAWRRRPVGEMLLVNAGVAAYLFRGPAAFGLFKLAMYAQPFLLGSVALGWARMRPGVWKYAALAGLTALIPLQLSTQWRYVSLSASGPNAGGPTPRATEERLFAKYREAVRNPSAERVLVPVADRVSWMLLASIVRDKPLFVPDALSDLPGAFFGHSGEAALGLPDRLITEENWAAFNRMKSAGAIDLKDPANPGLKSELGWDTPDWLDHPKAGDYLVEPPKAYELFNRFHRPENDRDCRLVPLSDVRNFLFWRHNSLSRKYAYHPEEPSGLWDLQADCAFRDSTMAAAGRFVTLQVLNPSSTVRLLVAGSSTYLPGDQRLPAAAAIGNCRLPLPFTGHGASRVVSEPFQVQMVGNRKFVVLDLGEAATPNQPAHPLNWDPRRISFYLRDVSLLSEEDYARMSPPSELKAFPADLAHPHLEFSGCGEDGSLGRQCWFRLFRPGGANAIIVRGRIPRKIPELPPLNQLTVKWKGRCLDRRELSTDEFEIRLSLPATEGLAGASTEGPGKLELEFSDAFRPAGVPRPVSAQLTYIGFESSVGRNP